MNEREKDNKRKDQYRFFVSPSKFYEDIFRQSFLCKQKNIITCGYPRNDFLFEDSMILEKLRIERGNFDKIIVYMPTFRIPKGGSYSDSDSCSTCIDMNDRQSIISLSEYLESKRILMIIKWHPADSRQTIINNVSNVISINNQFFDDNDLQTYHLLHYADALITDYSSVFCDYLLLDRPIAFDISDIDSYANKRGFVFDHPIDYMPGYKIKSEQDLMSFIDDVSNKNDRFSYLRMELSHIYNDFYDGNSSERIVNMIVV